MELNDTANSAVILDHSAKWTLMVTKACSGDQRLGEV